MGLDVWLLGWVDLELVFLAELAAPKRSADDSTRTTAIVWIRKDVVYQLGQALCSPVHELPAGRVKPW